MVRLVVQADADAIGDAATASGTLGRCRLRNRFDLQLLDLVAIAVALHARQSRIDHVPDPGHRERGFRDVGRQHDAARRAALEHALLLLGRQPRIERQDLGARRVVLAQGLGRLANFALAGQEHQHVAPACAGQLVDRIDDGVHQRAVIGIVLIAHRPVAHLHRIKSPGYVDHRGRLRRAEVARESLGIERGRGDDQLQVRAPGQQLAQVPEQEVDVQTAFVRLVDDDRVVGQQARIALGLRQQNAVGHQLDRDPGARLVRETNLVTDHFAQWSRQFLGDAPGHAGGRNAARLGMADHALASAPDRQADLRDLRGLTRAGFAAHDHDRIDPDRLADLVATAAHRQLVGKGNRRPRPRALV